MTSKCKKNYVLNPSTNRCIKKNGATAKKIGKSPSTKSKPKPKSKSKKSKSPPKPKKSPKPKSSPKPKENPKFNVKLPKKEPENKGCYKFNGIKICEHVKSRYFEEQIQALCGLHSINNLLQNQRVITSYKDLHVFTKKELDDECKLWHNSFPNHECYETGWYTMQIIQSVLRKFIPDLIQSNYVGNEGFDNSMLELKYDKHVLGAIVLYKSPACGNHFVSIIPENATNKFLVIDSNFKKSLGHEELQVIDTEQEVKKYFEKFLEILVLKIY